MADFLTFMHIFFVALLLFTLGALTFASVRLRRTDDLNEFRIFMNLMMTGGMLAPIGLIGAGIFGVLAAWEIGFELTAGWLIAAYIASGVALVVPALTFKPWGEAADRLMEQATSEGRILDEQKELMTGTRYTAVELFMNGLLIFILFVMVYKPF